jgi:hypothetical protein
LHPIQIPDIKHWIPGFEGVKPIGRIAPWQSFNPLIPTRDRLLKIHHHRPTTPKKPSITALQFVTF